MLGAHVLVTAVARLALGGGEDVEHAAAGGRGADGRSAGGGQLVDQLLRLGADGHRVDTELLQQRAGQALGVVEQRHCEVGRLDGRVAALGGGFDRGRHGLLAAGGQVHAVTISCRSTAQCLFFGCPDDESGRRRVARRQLGTRVVEFGGQFGDALAQRVDVGLELDDAFDAGEVDALVLREALHLAQQRDVARRVAPPAAAGASRRDQAEPVVLAQRLRVHAGQLRGDRDDEDRRVLGDVLTPAACSPPRASAAVICGRGSSCCVVAYFCSASRASSVSAVGTATSTVTSRSPVADLVATPRPRTRIVRPDGVPGATLSETEPSRVGTRNVVPSVASANVIGTVSVRSLPARPNSGCGRTRTVTKRSPARPAASTRRALAGDAQLRAVLDAGRNAHGDRAGLHGRAAAVALGARIFDDLAGAAALAARLAEAEAALVDHHHAAAAAVGARVRRRARTRTRCRGRCGTCRARQLQRQRRPAHGLVEAERDLGRRVLALDRTAPRSSGAARCRRRAAEQVGEQVAEPAAAARAEQVGHVEGRAAGVPAGVVAAAGPIAAAVAAEQRPRLVVLLALLRIRQHVVGLGHLFEACLGLGVARVLVRVQVTRELAVGLLDARRVRVLGDAERGVVVLLDVVLSAHETSPPRLTRNRASAESASGSLLWRCRIGDADHRRTEQAIVVLVARAHHRRAGRLGDLVALVVHDGLVDRRVERIADLAERDQTELGEDRRRADRRPP